MPEKENQKLYEGADIDPPKAVTPCDLAYAELDVTTNFSFLRGASHPDELVYTAAYLGYRAMAITDVNTFAGVVRAFEKARTVKGFQLIVGVRLNFIDDTPDLLAWPTNRDAYGRLCQLLTLGRNNAPKGECHLTLNDFLAHSDGTLAAAVLNSQHTESDAMDILHDALSDRFSLAVSMLLDGNDVTHLQSAVALSRRTGVPLLATNHVHYHDHRRRMLQDVLTCVRHGCVIQEAGYRLFPNAERYLKTPQQMHRLFAEHPRALRRGIEIAEQCTFRLDELKYFYPLEDVPEGVPPSLHLRKLTYEGAKTRYPHGIPDKVVGLLEKELKFICGSEYESYFLTVFDLVNYARSRGILCQGRGSAANSAVCYCLGVTAVDPARFQLVFERFASSARAEPPDIDIDFEHERREEVIQYVYNKYGRDRAAMTGSLITYRGRSAIRDVGKALGFSQDMLDTMAGKLDWWHKGTLSNDQCNEAGIDPSEPTIRQLVEITTELLGFPRHLSQHVGGMVISRKPLNEIVPILPAAMEDRTVIEWDKDDLDVLKLFKVDILALGMMTCISKSLALVNLYSDAPPMELHTIPPEDSQTYDMACDADTIGVFQIESRAQMSMLPRLQPREFYDLVIEVAIVRPGPIQGKMVHPYLQRREQRRNDRNFKIEFPNPKLEEVLRQTLGVPLFQEQAMRLAIVAADFTPEEADQLRRAMAAWKRGGGIQPFYEKFVGGMLKNNYEPEFAERCFQQISGFGEYGFPESHAASFAVLVYASAWLKRHHPAAFAAGLLNSQPMGFYAPAQIVRDAREHGVEVRPVDVNNSIWDCTLEQNENSTDQTDAGSEVLRRTGSCYTSGSSEYLRAGVDENNHTSLKHTWGLLGPSLRLGFRQIKGMKQDEAIHLARMREQYGPFTSVDQFQRVTQLSAATIRRLAQADAFSSLEKTRRMVLWDAMALDNTPAPLVLDTSIEIPAEPTVSIPIMPALEEVITDYATVGLSLKQHPVSFARQTLASSNVKPANTLKDPARTPHNRWIKVAGLVLVRQRPGTASGVVFITLEDETGVANLILWSAIYERYRRAARHATLLQAEGYIQREGSVVHVLAKRLFDRSDLLIELNQPARNFH